MQWLRGQASLMQLRIHRSANEDVCAVTLQRQPAHSQGQNFKQPCSHRNPNRKMVAQGLIKMSFQPNAITPQSMHMSVACLAWCHTNMTVALARPWRANCNTGKHSTQVSGRSLAS